MRNLFQNKNLKTNGMKQIPLVSEIETKTCRIKTEVKSENEGIIHAVVSVFGNEDSDGDVMVKGAFASTIAKSEQRGKYPPGIWHHDWYSPVAKTLKMWEEDDGLHVEAKFNLETQIGKETFSNIKHGIIDEYSFGFRTLDSERKDGKRYVKDVDMKEWSPVLWGSNPETQTLAVKQQQLQMKSNVFSGVEQQLLFNTINRLSDKFWRVGYDLAYGKASKEEKLDYLNEVLGEFSSLMNKYCGMHLSMIDEITVVDEEDVYYELGDDEFTEVKDDKLVVYKKNLQKIAQREDIKTNDELKSSISQAYSIVRLKTGDNTFLPPWLDSKSHDSNLVENKSEGNSGSSTDNESVEGAEEAEVESPTTLNHQQQIELAVMEAQLNGVLVP